MNLPIEYRAVLVYGGGQETTLDLHESGWLSRPEFQQLERFTLEPLVGDLPTVSVDLSPLPDGTDRRLVYFSRVFGQIEANGETARDLFRMYCVGWQATVGGRNVKAVNWIYPGGAVVLGDEPYGVNLLIEHFAKLSPQESQE